MSPVNCSATLYFSLENFSNPLDPSQRMGLATVFCILAATSFLGNVWALISTTKRVYQTLYKCCLLSLAASDFLIGFFVSLDNVMRLITPDISWQLGHTLCHFIPFLTTAAVIASAFTLTCVAADRYHGLAWLHDNFKPNLFVSIVIISTIWAISFGASVQMYFLYTPNEYCVVNISTINDTFECVACCTICLAASAKYPDYFTALYATIFVPLLLVFLLSYAMIAFRVWERAKRHALRSTHTPSTVTTTTETGFPTTPRNSPPETVHIKKKLRTFRVVLIITATFVICRLPQWTYTLITLQTSVDSNAGFVAKYCLSALTVFNTAINPLLYTFLDSLFVFHLKCLTFFGIRRQ